jgi:hypothetical protein
VEGEKEPFHLKGAAPCPGLMRASSGSARDEQTHLAVGQISSFLFPYQKEGRKYEIRFPPFFLPLPPPLVKSVSPFALPPWSSSAVFPVVVVI